MALNILCNKGIGAFITTNYYVTALGGYKLRKDLHERASLSIMLNFNELKIFKSALGQHNMIALFRKNNSDKEKCKLMNVHSKGVLKANLFRDIILGIHKETKYSLVSQAELFEGKELYIRLSKETSESLLTKVLQKISLENDILGNICHVNVGLRSGLDRIKNKHLEKFPDMEINQGVFVIDNRVDVDGETIVKSFYKNSDIHKYYTSDETNLNVIYSTNTTKIENYPKVYQHLLQYKDVIEEYRWAEGVKWYALVRPRKSEMFCSEKIVAPQRSKINTFGYNCGEWYASSDVYYITAKNKDYPLKYILGLLNSKLYYLWLYNKGKRKGETLELYQKPLSEIPVKKPHINECLRISQVVNNIIIEKKENPQADTTSLENQIDFLVYHLYGLTYDEVLIVDPNPPFTREEYEAYKGE